MQSRGASQILALEESNQNQHLKLTPWGSIYQVKIVSNILKQEPLDNLTIICISAFGNTHTKDTMVVDAQSTNNLAAGMAVLILNFFYLLIS